VKREYGSVRKLTKGGLGSLGKGLGYNTQSNKKGIGELGKEAGVRAKDRHLQGGSEPEAGTARGGFGNELFTGEERVSEFVNRSKSWEQSGGKARESRSREE